ncbi:hypothetical protein CPAR01_14759 [Colletotrichum paranaense]|uniref:Uncharacterized protein n=3 Tax=Colletotrichum acutatum species complex TaxID=2707335 RepID=A0AAI9YXN1_9PEZI|nr:uncharacterized protein CCOS01_07780 [Colletotrichum costaricense]XP_060342472.1 uncharacterized protein CPAR01_14759 [Colletotrichum paranaense]XP_060384659.1 uncharacterized protein CTAM01_04675 [Colletotrichum tamarilloi]XP_060405798.1 uncharacterized protein CABS01_05256 [Colletotrichum abscissum]KAK1503363.1 hypothetical protein CTAM01_04675 [Colletotrichum tamarilloi]KAK1521842.1 hypothetical protein CPAR01_14759 [Colletotrichum paranaense]KAK1523635.1 hypothetical protein CABS01_052
MPGGCITYAAALASWPLPVSPAKPLSSPAFGQGSVLTHTNTYCLCNDTTLARKRISQTSITIFFCPVVGSSLEPWSSDHPASSAHLFCQTIHKRMGKFPSSPPPTSSILIVPSTPTDNGI